jgi:N-acetylglucosaminyldiphosphoundecaprenol N-acetyl-beta-D-mannosaminyltransferase
MDTVTLLGLRFDNLNVVETVKRLVKRDPASAFAYVVTSKVQDLVRLRRSPALISIHEGAWLRLLDSEAISKLARLFRIRAMVSTGVDVTALLLASLRGQSVAVIGLHPAHLPALQQRCPEVHFILHTPPINLLQNPSAFAAARDFAVASQAPFTLIGLGSPLQEVLAQAIAGQSRSTGIGLCVGEALEFCAGVAPRAPVWMRLAGLQWVHRLSQTVRHPKRYFIDAPPVLCALALQTLKSRWPAGRGNPLPQGNAGKLK